jgi:predicted secreted protein
MNKRTRIALALSFVTLGILWCVYFLVRDTNAMKSDHSYNVRTGETFSIQLPYNPSTGYRLCRISENSTRHVQLVRSETKMDRPGVPGSGGSLFLTFTATSAGTDTLKFRSIPPFSDCNNFQYDTVKAQYTFVIRVNE